METVGAARRVTGGAVGAAVLVMGGVLTTAPPRALAQARPAVRVDPATAAPSSEVVATGDGFQARGTVSLYVGTVVPGQEVAVVALANGAFDAAFRAPAREGRYAIVACRDLDASGACREQASTTLAVVRPPVSTTTTSTTTTTPRPGQVATTTTTSPGNLELPPGPTSTDSTTPSSSTTAPGDTVPEPTASSTSTSAGATTATGSRPAAGIELDRTAASPGEHATVTGWGCDPRAPVSVELAGRPAANVRTDHDGAFTARFEIPELDAGRYRVVARCPGPRATDLDVVFVTSVRPVTGTLAVLVFFVLSILGVARRFLGTGATERGSA